MGGFGSGQLALSPAAAMIVEGAAFRAGDRLCVVRDVFPCEEKPLSSLLLLIQDSAAGDDLHIPLRAIQMRELEDWIAQDRVRFQFGSSALDYNEMCGEPSNCRAVTPVGVSLCRSQPVREWRRPYSPRAKRFEVRAPRPTAPDLGSAS